jgi:hypothetical protein
MMVLYCGAVAIVVAATAMGGRVKIKISATGVELAVDVKELIPMQTDGRGLNNQANERRSNDGRGSDDQIYERGSNDRR